MRLSGKVAIIAGAPWGGIGGATALLFAREGAKVVVNTRSSSDKLQQTVDRIVAAGGEAAMVMGDVAEEATWQELVRVALERFGTVTTLVHNAASTVVKAPIDITPEEWNYSIAATLTGPWLGAKYCIPEMIKAGGGSIVNVSTVNSFISNPGFAAYSSAKAGLNALTRSLALEYGRAGIRANAIAPGQIVGENKPMEPGSLDERASIDCYPLGRYGTPEDIANVALFLASDESAFVTGATLVADGGLTLQSPEALVRPVFRRRWRDDILVPQPHE